MLTDGRQSGDLRVVIEDIASVRGMCSAAGPAARVARTYSRCVEGAESGKTYRAW